MTTHAELAAKLLRESAKFFRAVGEDNPGMVEDMQSMAEACETVAGLVEKSPTAELNAASFSED